MAILFKTYNGRHQLHLCNEHWAVANKQELDEVLGLFGKKEMSKIVVKPINEKIDLEFHDAIIDCRDLRDLKYKFGLVADIKEKYQKNEPQKKVKK